MVKKLDRVVLADRMDESDLAIGDIANVAGCL